MNEGSVLLRKYGDRVLSMAGGTQISTGGRYSVMKCVPPDAYY